MRNQFSIKKFYFLVLLAVVGIGKVHAGNTYYAKVTARATGAGTVYAESNGQDGATGSESTAIGTTETGGGNVAFTFNAYPNDNYDFKGWAETNNENATTISNDETYTRNYAAARSDGENNAISYNIYAIFAEKPLFYFSGVAVVTPSGAGTATVTPETTSARGEKWNSTSATTNAITFSASPELDYEFLGWSNAENGEIVSSNNPYKPTITSTSTNSGVPTKTTLYARFQARSYPTNITATPTSITLGVGDSSTPISVAINPSNAYRNIGFESDETSIATVDANGVVTGKAIGNATITVKALKSDGTTVITTTTVPVTVMGKCATPSITIDASGKVTITCDTDGSTIYYTTDGSDPTISSSSAVYNDPFTVAEKVTVKAMAAKSGYKNSSVASSTYETSNPTGVKDGVVTLNDLEDHNWTYYSGVNTSVDGGNYNNNYAGKLYSPNPRNVKITYTANGGAVSIDESETSFVYYKTLEQGATAGQYPYTVISNPFSKRPTGKGFGGWKIISGGDYINGYNNGSTLPLDQEITFVNLPYTSTNCISAEIELEATWVNAQVTYLATVNNNNNNYTFNDTNGSSTTYENNFLVINRSYSGTLTLSQPVTIMMVEPDGSVDYRNSNTFTGNITPNNTGVTKIEFAKWNPNGNINATGRNVTLGRGLTMGGTGRTIYGTNSNLNINQVFKIESGTYSTFYAIGSSGPSNNMTKQQIILGNDYDRANKGGDNSNLSITNNMYLLGKSSTIGTDKLKIIAKSGKFTPNLNHSTAQKSDNCFYLWYNSGGGSGTRELVIEGGEFWHIAGGYDSGNSNNSVNLKIRMKGGTIHGSIYGGAAKYDTKGYKQFIFTGGTVEGWIAGGSNGYLADGDDNLNGTIDGRSYVYIGGKTQVTSGNSTTAIDMSVGGNVYGAGCGNTTVNNSGRVTNQTNVVIADECYVQRGVYGGGAYGSSPGTANVYITGNAHVGGVYESTFDVYGGVYGGARAKDGGSTNIYMTGGDVEHGVYGGSNLTGTINNNVTMQINGGQVGTSSAPANIHGGGYGKDTKVDGNVTLTLGSNTTDPGVTVYGDVYGGSALGTVNDANSDKTEVTLNCGTINGSLYGGGLGNATEEANVNGAVTVTVNGGSVKKTSVEGSGGVYGANNVNGEPKSSVAVVINGTAPAPSNEEYALYAVYGGGNQADYNYTAGPTVTVNNCENSIEYVYGGGNAAAVKTTNVTIWGGNVIGNVFGGGHGYKDGAGADVEGDVNVAIKGGTIKKVFGGSNSKGNISGTINLEIDKEGDCDMRIGEVYGGGNEAAGNAGTINIGCTGALVEGNEGHAAHPEEIGKTLEGIGAVYGGANNANVTNDSGITLNINSGMVANAFGGNNTGGDITGGITVNINKNANTCGWYVGNVYGAGNLAQYSGSPAVNILNGEVSGNVYGGGKGDANDHSKGQVTGNPTVTIGDKSNAGYEAIVKGDVYGGGDAGNVVGIPVVNVVNKCNTTIGNVYGGGNAADVNGTDVNIDGGTITGMVFGGGHGDKNASPQTEANVKGNVNVDITGGTIGKVFGGSNSKGNINGTIALNIEKADGHCELHITEVYGGGNEAAGNAGTITIGCTGGEGEGIGDVYGGANAADINTPITLNITGGNIKRVFGGNNASGAIKGDIAVNVNWDTENPCGVNYLGNVYGAGNLAPYTGNTAVNILNGTVTGNVFGGGLGAAAVVTGTTVVNVNGNGAVVTQNVLGGGDAANVAGSTDVNMIAGAVQGSVFGGGNAAGVSDASVVDVTGGTIGSGVYGGSNASGTVGSTQVTLTNGQVGNNTTRANVHGGGYGEATVVSGNVQVNIQGSIIYGDVYGGSALGTVNTDANNTTAVNLTGGIIHGDAYGGGLGDSDTAADVNGNVTVTLNGTAFTLATTKDNENNIIPTSGRVFGCNNINGSPKGTVLVKVERTVGGANKPEKGSGVYELQAVYGGGNLAAYNPTDPAADGQFTSYTWGEKNVAHVNTNKPVQVVIDGCDKTSIEYVYGGGNAAATPATDVTVLGSYEIGSVFGGGNGKDKYTLDGATWEANQGADVGIINAAAYKADNSQGKYGTGDAMTSVLGGTVHNIYGGSNTLGNIVGDAIAFLDEASDCDLVVDNIYGGGNEAYMDGDASIQLGCIESLKEIYGGARNADVRGDINLTITSGHFDRVFGGNNLGGAIKGSITVTIEETGCNPITIGELYGGGNLAAYSVYGYDAEGNYKESGTKLYNDPVVNILSFSSIGRVFGGGLGNKAVMVGSPTVNINENVGANANNTEWRYLGQTISYTDGSSVTLPTRNSGAIGAIGTVFGGGNAAPVIGNTQVNIGTTTGKADIRGNVYGGGNQANVSGKTNVVIGQ